MSKIMYQDTQYGGTLEVNNLSSLIDLFYPVGSYYQTSDSTFNPNTDGSGTWTLLGEGQVLISAGTNYTEGQSYGSNTGTLSDDQLMHTHGFTDPTYKATGAAVGDHAATACTRTTNAAVTASGAHSHSISALHYVSGVTDLKPPSGANWKQESISTGSTGAHTHTMTQPAFSTPKFTHSVTQPTISVNTSGSVTKIGTVSTRSSYSTMQASTAAYIWHRTA